jgi:hypothetical protein
MLVRNRYSIAFVIVSIGKIIPVRALEALRVARG